MLKEKRTRVTIALDKEDYTYLANLAHKHGLSFSDIARLVLKEGIDARKQRFSQPQTAKQA